MVAALAEHGCYSPERVARTINSQRTTAYFLKKSVHDSPQMIDTQGVRCSPELAGDAKRVATIVGLVCKSAEMGGMALPNDAIEKRAVTLKRDPLHVEREPAHTAELFTSTGSPRPAVN